jgi:hypothetical protein
MSRYYFEVDRVVSMSYHPEKETGYKWFEKVTAIPKTFLGIKYGMTEEIPEGWSSHENGRYRKTLEDLRYYNWNLINEETKEIRHKSQISVNLTDNTSYGQYFDSEDEAEDYIYSLQEVTGKEFYPIGN